MFLHPDKVYNNNIDTRYLFHLISTANNILGDQDKRKILDLTTDLDFSLKRSNVNINEKSGINLKCTLERFFKIIPYIRTPTSKILYRPILIMYSLDWHKIFGKFEPKRITL